VQTILTLSPSVNKPHGMKTTRLTLFRTDTRLPRWADVTLGILPFVLVVGLYLWGAYYIRDMELRNTEQATASSKLMPLPSQMWAGFKRSAFVPDSKGDYRLWVDTQASCQRFFIGMAFVALGVVIGLYMGTFPIIESLLFRFFVFVDKVPPLLLLPILFIVFDVGELSKVALVVIGVLPGVVLDACRRTREIPHEQYYKAQTLGASESEIAWSVIFPQILPRMLGTLRLSFKAAWSYVIAGESIAAAVGIGYRIFVLRRYVAMDIIIPYVIWATIIMFLLDYMFQWVETRFKWVDQ
jgi:NitT/TauT family transport system permease protein